MNITKKLFLMLAVLLNLSVVSMYSIKEIAGALNTIDHYINMLDTLPSQDLENLIKYLKYYRSWYQAVPPAPRELYESLSLQAHTFITALKEKAQAFTRPPQMIAGYSQLTEEGNKFYQRVIRKLEVIWWNRELAQKM